MCRLLDRPRGLDVRFANLKGVACARAVSFVLFSLRKCKDAQIALIFNVCSERRRWVCIFLRVPFQGASERLFCKQQFITINIIIQLVHLFNFIKAKAFPESLWKAFGKL